MILLLFPKEPTKHIFSSGHNRTQCWTIKSATPGNLYPDKMSNIQNHCLDSYCMSSVEFRYYKNYQRQHGKTGILKKRKTIYKTAVLYCKITSGSELLPFHTLHLICIKLREAIGKINYSMGRALHWNFIVFKFYAIISHFRSLRILSKQKCKIVSLKIQ